ncbi:single-stranded DNA-binding protein [Lactobacillus sp. ESL0236]|uniref:single-stranded DNA-binding protein n=1 Tax=unclassified Lactobacillus TaxID=2620435 RepID=UPI000EFAACD3|nr:MULTISPECIES: single-stranded DNA-binding protein [unclassified Lactobacillus]RMC36941.1 single-stranded DNA-binding protein [Lactobacillus sp. ESL0237]RMC42465.1 single-stranded DNA-binding protein [Lactobacillus sp. ESL0234]RMC43162.1 single-stranded DNA-binding protein [Lactobacillus sp. ESL0236]
MINRTVLTGRLTRDPELKTTQSGLSVATFTLAVNRQYTNAQGEREADFISCVIWRKAAENFCNFTSKGSLVGIDGRIQTRSYDGQNGQKVYVTEVVVDSFSLLESKKDRQNSANTGNDGGYSSSGGNTGNSNNSSPQDPFSGSSDTIDITDDDLPF